MQLIENWRQGWKFWSVQLGALAAALLAFGVTFPDQVFELWALLPGEARALVPQDWVQKITLFLIVIGIVAKFIKQKNLKPVEQPTKGNETND